MDLSTAAQPKSDQLNADDLIGGPQLVTIAEVRKGNDEQPVEIVTTEFGPRRPYRPGKSMIRVLIAAWGKEASAYPGRQLMLYRDPNITFGSDKVGGIRISAMSHIPQRLTLALTVTRGRRKPFVVEPLPESRPVEQAESADEMVTKPQLQKLSILRQREGYGDDDDGRADWFRWVQTNIARSIGTNKDLTKAEASVLIDVLESAQTSEAGQ